MIRVGYAQTNLRSGFTATGTAFFPFTGTGIPLTSFQFDTENLYGISIQTLNATGATVENITWDDWTYEDPCWVDSEGNPTTMVVSPGDGLWIQGATGDSITTAGKVGTSDVDVVWETDGFRLVANPYPVAVSVADLVFTTTAGDLYGISIQTLNATGGTVDNITWDDWTYEAPCWVDSDGNPATATIDPGTAVWIQAGEGDTLRIPAPEL